jgi:hypothetical protein
LRSRYHDDCLRAVDNNGRTIHDAARGQIAQAENFGGLRTSVGKVRINLDGVRKQESQLLITIKLTMLSSPVLTAENVVNLRSDTSCSLP